MNEHFCEKEQQVVAALCDSLRDTEILAHARSCHVCSEVAELLRESAQLATHELSALPDAALIWRTGASPGPGESAGSGDFAHPNRQNFRLCSCRPCVSLVDP
jgi:hypothetical protein